MPWLAADISLVGVKAVSAIKQGLDPANIMNPGRLMPSSTPLEDWLALGSPLKPIKDEISLSDPQPRRTGRPYNQ